MSDYNNHTRELLVAAAVGSVIAAGAASLFISKKCSKEERGIKSKCYDYKEKIEDFILSLEDNIETQISNKKDEWYQTAKDAAESLKDEFDTFTGEDHGGLKAGLALGGILGVIVGVEAARLCSRESSRKQSDFKTYVAENAPNWKKVIEAVLDLASDQNGRKFRKIQQNSKVSDIVDIVDAGIQLWKRVQK